MTAYVVSVQCGSAGVFNDSIWIKKESAEARSARLLEEFKRQGFEDPTRQISTWKTRISETEIHDAIPAEEK